MEALRNTESCVVPEGDDDGVDRVYWTVDRCPGNDDPTLGKCSAASWRKASVWSYESENAVKCYLKHHLMNSGSHLAEEITANAWAETAPIKEIVETYDEREQYRKGLDKMYSASTAATAAASARPIGMPAAIGARPAAEDDEGDSMSGKGGKGKSKGKKGGKGKSADVAHQLRRTNEEVSHLKDNLQQLAKRVKRTVGGGGSSSSSGDRDATVTIKLRDLHLVHDSLNRAHHAATQCESLCTKLAKQFETEAKVIDKAKDVVKSLCMQHEGTVQLV